MTSLFSTSSCSYVIRKTNDNEFIIEAIMDQMANILITFIKRLFFRSAYLKLIH